MTLARDTEVWVTGVGLVSSMGEGPEAHAAALGETPPAPVVDHAAFAPYPTHPLPPVAFEKQLPPRDIRQMELWQRLGTYTAGLALDHAGARDQVSGMDLVVAAGIGEGNLPLNEALHAELAALPPEEAEAHLNMRLSGGLRPTLFLAQLPNLLAGNITIVHGVTASSRTLMGEEAAAADALRIAHQRIVEGRSRIALAGGAWNGARWDLITGYGLNGGLWHGAWAPVAERQARGGGMCLGSMAAFLVLEAADHARARGAVPLARLAAVATAAAWRDKGQSAGDSGRALLAGLAPRLLPGCGVASAATGLPGPFAEEAAMLDHAALTGPRRYTTDLLGHAPEASFPAAVALAALALHGKAGPAQWLVSGFGQFRGEALALLEAVP